MCRNQDGGRPMRPPRALIKNSRVIASGGSVSFPTPLMNLYDSRVGSDRCRAGRFGKSLYRSHAIYFFGKIKVKICERRKTLFNLGLHRRVSHPRSEQASSALTYPAGRLSHQISYILTSELLFQSFLFLFLHFVIVFSLPKLAIVFAQFCTNQNVTISRKGPFML